MSNLRYFMSKSLIHKILSTQHTLQPTQNPLELQKKLLAIKTLNIKEMITNVIISFMVERYVRISTADSQNSYLVLLLALSEERIFLRRYLKQKMSEKMWFSQ